MKWPVVPISAAQMLDVRPEDCIYENVDPKIEGSDVPLYRIADLRRTKITDKLPELARRYLKQDFRGRVNPGIGNRALHTIQFIAQLRECHLDCPYCYVTRAGVWGDPVERTTDELIEDFYVYGFFQSQATVFHLMGGAPALYLDKWLELIDGLVMAFGRFPVAVPWLFHSDFTLTEGVYNEYALQRIGDARAIYAVNVKGATAESYKRNTGKELPEELQIDNYQRILNAPNLQFYTTFTNLPEEEIELFWKKVNTWKVADHKVEAARANSYSIDLVPYKAIEWNIDMTWGAGRKRVK